MKCPKCNHTWSTATTSGIEARRQNGRKGGRPPKPGSIAAGAYWTRKAEEAEAQGNLMRAAECRAKAGG